LYGVAQPAGTLDLDVLFGRKADRILEIGFGDGQVLSQLATIHPYRDYLGIEVHQPGVGALLLAIDKGQLSNVRVVRDDAADVLTSWLAPNSLSRVNLYFPDPWPKKRHHKRRIVQAGFLEQVARVLVPHGTLHMATDWQPYAEHMLEVANASPWFDNSGEFNTFVPRPEDRPETKFERRGLGLGHGVWDLIYTRN
jgi:tRNA (guanine-N7-)-methyltransferase